MTERKYKTGMRLFKGQEVYNLPEEKRERLSEDLVISEWQDHIGHIRFGFNGKRYSFTTSYNKSGYEYLY